MSSANDPDEDPPILSRKDIAREFGVSTRTVERWFKGGMLVSDVRTLGGHRRFRRSTVRRLQEKLDDGAAQAAKPQQGPQTPESTDNLRDEASGTHGTEWPFNTRLDEADLRVARNYEQWRWERWNAARARWRAENSKTVQRARAAEQRWAARQKEKARQAKLAALAENYFQRILGLTVKQVRAALRKEPLMALAAKAGITEAALRKSCKRYGVATKPRGHWQKVRAGRAARTALQLIRDIS